MRMHALAVSLPLVLLLSQSQPPIRILNPTNPNPIPSDARMMQFDVQVEGASWRVFAVDAYPGGPVAFTQVAEVRQQNPPSSWAFNVTNRALMPLASVTIAAAVVDVNGKVKATQTLPTLKNLKPGQNQRRETKIRVTVIAPTDRVVFFLKDLKSELGDWTAVDADVASLIKAAADRLPVP
jgi:hypothetical protein